MKRLIKLKWQVWENKTDCKSPRRKSRRKFSSKNQFFFRFHGENYRDKRLAPEFQLEMDNFYRNVLRGDYRETHGYPEEKDEKPIRTLVSVRNC